MKDLNFKVGDKVKSDPNSSDVTTMKATWNAVIHKIVDENDSGGCYETVGTWIPLLDDNGNPDSFWEEHNPSEEATLRQLWGTDIVRREKANA